MVNFFETCYAWLMLRDLSQCRNRHTTKISSFGQNFSHDYFSLSLLLVFSGSAVFEPPRPTPFEIPELEVFISASRSSATINQETITLTCCAQQFHPQREILWLFNGQGILPRRTYVDTQSRLVLDSVLREHAGEYECIYKIDGVTEFATGRMIAQGGQVYTINMNRRCGL